MRQFDIQMISTRTVPVFTLCLSWFSLFSYFPVKSYAWVPTSCISSKTSSRQQKQRQQQEYQKRRVSFHRTNLPVMKAVADIDIDEDSGTARSDFGTRDYWDELYQGRGDFPADEYSWYYGWEGYQSYVRQYVPEKNSRILIPGIGNDPILLDLIDSGYNDITATDYSEHAIERQEDLLSYFAPESSIELQTMDARQMDDNWTNRFDAILEKGALDAIYLSGDGNLELAVKELARIVKPGGVLVSVSGVIPPELRRTVFSSGEGGDWEWLRDGSSDLQAGVFVISRRGEE